jgi:hypothetical protein
LTATDAGRRSRDGNHARNDAVAGDVASEDGLPSNRLLAVIRLTFCKDPDGRP